MFKPTLKNFGFLSHCTIEARALVQILSLNAKLLDHLKYYRHAAKPHWFRIASWLLLISSVCFYLQPCEGEKKLTIQLDRVYKALEIKRTAATVLSHCMDLQVILSSLRSIHCQWICPEQLTEFSCCQWEMACPLAKQMCVRQLQEDNRMTKCRIRKGCAPKSARSLSLLLLWQEAWRFEVYCDLDNPPACHPSKPATAWSTLDCACCEYLWQWVGKESNYLCLCIHKTSFSSLTRHEQQKSPTS